MGGQRPRTAWGQFQPVHASGHVDVREQHRNVRARFQPGYCFVSIARLESHIACFLDNFDGEQSQQGIVFHNKYDWFAGWCAHDINDAKPQRPRCIRPQCP
jgi:hypothetical protein